MTNGENLKLNTLSNSLVYRCVSNLNQKIPLVHFVLFYKGWQQSLTYGSIWKNLDTKGYRNGYNNIIGRLWSPNYGSRIEWEASRKGTEYFIMVTESLGQRKTAEITVKCQANFLAHLLSSSIGKVMYFPFK